MFRKIQSRLNQGQYLTEKPHINRAFIVYSIIISNNIYSFFWLSNKTNTSIFKISLYTSSNNVAHVS